MTESLEQDAKSWLTSTEAAAVAGCSVSSLYRWELMGRITPIRTPGGHRRYVRRDVEALMSRAGDAA